MKKLSLILLSLVVCFTACDRTHKSATGVAKVAPTVKTTVVHNGQNVTLEQANILDRYERNNDPGAVKHLYVVSCYSGDVILYSTVKGKVTSSGKRLTPYSVNRGMVVKIGNQVYTTPEVLQDDGTYGSSNPYLYWSDARGVYHEHYVSGGQIVHVSDAPMSWPKIILNLEEAKENR